MIWNGLGDDLHWQKWFRVEAEQPLQTNLIDYAAQLFNEILLFYFECFGRIFVYKNQRDHDVSQCGCQYN